MGRIAKGIVATALIGFVAASVVDGVGDSNDLGELNRSSVLEAMIESNRSNVNDEIYGAEPLMDINSWGPEFDPDLWDDKPSANCYSYVMDLLVEDFGLIKWPVPGSSSGYVPPELNDPLKPYKTTENYVRGLIADGAIPLSLEGEVAVKLGDIGLGFDVRLSYRTLDQSASDLKLKGMGYLMALFVDEGVDFHCARLDSNGRWSHKKRSLGVERQFTSLYAVMDDMNANPWIQYDFVGFFMVPYNGMDVKVKTEFSSS
tara:strand:- start:9477 stop:10253 length:777 start_codon:yes stop_codon:yes gene_type:complete